MPTMPGTNLVTVDSTHHLLQPAPRPTPLLPLLPHHSATHSIGQHLDLLSRSDGGSVRYLNTINYRQAW